MSIAERLASALQHRAAEIGPKLAKLAYERGLAVSAPDGTTKPIAISLEPVIFAKSELARRRTLSAELSSAALKMANHTLASPRLREHLTSALSPLELRFAEGGPLSTLATARVDFFEGATLQALEVNSTIPAMQGYSDIAANTFIEVVAAAAGASPEKLARLQSANGSNAKALLEALSHGYARIRRGAEPHRIALLCRRGDAQITEQRALARAFTSAGVEAMVVHPDELSGTDAITAHGKRIDLIYRHIFVRRLEEGVPGADFVEKLLAEQQGTRVVVLNPPATQVEVKAIVALLSQSVEDSELAQAAKLTSDERDACATALPWTRIFRGDSLVQRAVETPEDYVLKRSWDYGGRAVFIGADSGDGSFSARASASFGAGVQTWAQVCAAAARADRGGFVIQQRVVNEATPFHLCSLLGLPKRTALHVDYSGYASVGLDMQPAWGGVCRGSASQIVNIQGGGGVLPLLTTEVATSLLELLERKQSGIRS